MVDVLQEKGLKWDVLEEIVLENKFKHAQTKDNLVNSGVWEWWIQSEEFSDKENKREKRKVNSFLPTTGVFTSLFIWVSS